MNRIIVLLILSLILSSCSTLHETTSSIYTSRPLPNYRKEINKQGEDVYRSRESNSPSLYQSAPAYEYTNTSSNAKTLTPDQGQSGIAGETSTLPKAQDSRSLKGLVAFTEFARENNNSHFGFHVGANIIDTPLVPRLGVSLFKSDHQVYAGFDGSIRVQLPNPNFSPFVGAGIYMGDTKKCSYKNNGFNSYEECEKKFLTSGYAEAGIQIRSVQAFFRNYKINRAGISIPSDQFWGVGLSFGGELF